MSDAKRITWGKPRRPSDADRDALRADLLTKARAVRADGWAEHRGTWAAGRVGGGANRRGDTALLTEHHETHTTLRSPEA
ncbi:hypothetical protein ACWDYD_25560, partial [Nocardia sp. NPDC003054]